MTDAFDDLAAKVLDLIEQRKEHHRAGGQTTQFDYVELHEAFDVLAIKYCGLSTNDRNQCRMQLLKVASAFHHFLLM